VTAGASSLLVVSWLGAAGAHAAKNSINKNEKRTIRFMI
jgi:hypothetical protein